VPDQNRNNVTFQSFVRDIFEPYLLKEVGKRFQEAQGQLEIFVQEKQLVFQEQVVKHANEWIRDQQQAFRQQAMSVQMLKGRIAALEQARRHNYDIDLKNHVVIRAAPPLPLVQAGHVHYAAEFVQHMVDERYKSFLTELASQNMSQQMRIDAPQQQFREQQQRLALTPSRLSPFETAVAEALCSRGQTPAAVSGLGKGELGERLVKNGGLTPVLVAFHFNRQPLLPIPWWLPSRRLNQEPL